MARRTPEKQSKHDRKVEAEAVIFRNQGYSVWADLAGWSKPDIINGHIPDVIARKWGWEKVVEVETEESVEQDKEQIAAFERYANSRPNTEFKLVIAY
ncbi:MAG: hypothetical protein Q7J54_01930 [Candidatus Woesearchaeota archaeon]|nr:hypothetical protein [Candidatus Woesearchaeota archaeon]